MKKILILNLLFVGILYSQDSELENVEEVCCGWNESKFNQRD